MAAYPHLFLPLKVGSHFLKNRIVMAPVETGLEKQDYFDPRVVEFYEERARGDGPGLFILGNGVVHETGLRNLKDPVLTAGLLNNAVRLTSVIHESGSKVLLQLQHHGAGADHMFAVSASRFRNRDTGRTLHRAPGLLVSHLISQYSLFAYHAILHGEFDGVEIYGGRLSLPNVFSSRLFNRRHDKWGLQARTLFAVELVRRIRSFVGRAASSHTAFRFLTCTRAAANGTTSLPLPRPFITKASISSVSTSALRPTAFPSTAT